MDPFESPATDARVTGTLDVGRAVSEAVGAAMANAVSAVGVVLLFTGAAIASFCTCVGWVVVTPVLVWGAYSWMLEALEGQGRVATLWSGMERFGHVFVRMWGLMLTWLLLSLPLMGVMMAITLPASLEAVASGEQPDPIQQTLVISAISVVFALLIVRVMIAPFFMVEQDIGPLDAFQRAWEVTTGQWGKLIVLQLLLTFLNLPGQVLSVGLQVYAQGIDQADPQQALDALPVMLALYAVIFTLSGAVAIVGQLFFASAYRQLVGPAAGGSVA